MHIGQRVRRFKALSSRNVGSLGTLGKSFACSCRWRFVVKLRHSIHAVLGAPLSSSGLEALGTIEIA